MLQLIANGFVFFFLVLISACQTNLSPRPVSAQQRSSPVAMTQPAQKPPLKLPLAKPRIVIKKAQRQLFLYSENKLLRTYRIGLGSNPVGDKVQQGDRRTPEGDFYIFTKNDKSAYYLSLGVSYPNAVHAQRGLRDGLITKAQYDAIMRALAAKKSPPQNTRLGGDIYIHGNGAQSDWTWGCAALADEEMLELFNAVPVGTPVRIEP
jgi:murein L,D-transpeptidase YafK